jgi:hypothetical protein
MKVIHFTAGATDRLDSSRGLQTRFVPLVRGGGATHVTCLHLLPGATVSRPPTEQDSAVLIVSGSTTLSLSLPELRLDLSGGVGVVLDAGESYSLASEHGAVAIAINATGLRATAEALSTPERVMGQLWPGDAGHSARIFRFPK